MDAKTFQLLPIHCEKSFSVLPHCAEENLERISYVLIDVEGKEPNVIRGMKLESKRHVFPIFQFELGGTWTDSRHDENQWGQYGVAMYLKALGYKLFMIGASLRGGEIPILLQVEPEFFRIFSFRPEVDVGGNLLSVHPDLVDPGLWQYLQSFVGSSEAKWKLSDFWQRRPSSSMWMGETKSVVTKNITSF